MKHRSAVCAAAVLLAAFAPPALPQPGGMKSMDHCKGMDMDRCHERMMKGKSDKKAQGEVHRGTGVVTNVDRAGGKVTLKHDPIKSLNWPTMTMAFGVRDKAMLEALQKDRKVEFEFVQQGQQFVITSIK